MTHINSALDLGLKREKCGVLSIKMHAVLGPRRVGRPVGPLALRLHGHGLFRAPPRLFAPRWATRAARPVWAGHVPLGRAWSVGRARLWAVRAAYQLLGRACAFGPGRFVGRGPRYSFLFSSELE